ncbi:MAG: choice-of-anchor tandem repeat GloVer-containing protein [Candidatus Korobacteraceae bacterium]
MVRQQIAAPIFDITLPTKTAGVVSWAVLAAVLTIGPMAPAQTLTVVHDFTFGADGGYPIGGLTQDSSGNLYGVAYNGGNVQCSDGRYKVGCGVVFKLSHHGSGWVFTTLYEFGGQPDGGIPLARMIFGPDGALYGTTSQGGNGACQGELGCGTVFKLQPPASFCRSFSCPWTETILYNFSSRYGGYYPDADLAFDSAGNLYGTTANGGGSVNCPNDGCGTAFELTPNSNGTWSKSTIHVFQAGADGEYPNTGFVVGPTGNLYGTTGNGGANGYGSVYQLSPAAGWSETVLYSFTNGADGYMPGQVTFDSSGNLWGPSDAVTIFELTPLQGGGWNFSVQYNFDYYNDGGYPNPLTLDASGNIYGTMSQSYSGGSVWNLTPSGSGWNYNGLYAFSYEDGSQGIEPTGRVALDSQGNIYGENGYGGEGYGTVWELTP